MFAKTIIDSDAFLDMPVTARLLYYDLAMRADDDGFINSPKKIMRIIGASQDDLTLLIAKKFIIPFENGIVVIKHWRIHNYIRKDRYVETTYSEQKDLLEYDENNAYRLKVNHVSTIGLPYDDHRLTQDRIGKDSIGKDSIDKSNTPKRDRFVPPTESQLLDYCIEANLNIDTSAFIDFYSSKGWKVGSQSMKDWKAAARNWARRDRDKKPKSNLGLFGDYKQTSKDEEWDDFSRLASGGKS